MARIRSVLPGQWTDPEFVKLSPLARLLVLALRHHADDNGIFIYEPIVLRLKCLPADNVDIHVLLAELEAQKHIIIFAMGGKDYGAIRNFRVYQRPRAPQYVHKCPPAVMDWVMGKTGKNQPELALGNAEQLSANAPSSTKMDAEENRKSVSALIASGYAQKQEQHSANAGLSPNDYGNHEALTGTSGNVLSSDGGNAACSYIASADGPMPYDKSRNNIPETPSSTPEKTSISPQRVEERKKEYPPVSPLEQNGVRMSAKPAKAKRVRGKAGTIEELEARLAALEITPTLRAWARANAPDIEPEWALGAFGDYCRSREKIPRYTDWTAAFRNYLRLKQDDRNRYGARFQPKAPTMSSSPGTEAFRKAYRDWDAGGRQGRKPIRDDFGA